MPTLIHIPVDLMRFVPTHTNSDGTTSALSPAKWPMEFILIVNEKEREAFLGHDRIQAILAPDIHDTNRLMPAGTLFFPTPPFTGHAP